jgi:AraC-like DNA-binding protein
MKEYRATMLRHLLTLCCALACLSTTPVVADEILEIPHRQGQLSIDARLDDWHEHGLRITLIDPITHRPEGNSATVRLAWDPQHIWFAVEMHDDEVFTAPADAEGTTLYQWDAFEVYLDIAGNGAERMDADDYQFILACDGRVAVLQGDPLIERWAVPKRIRPGLIIETAARRHAWGYVLEGAIPLVSLGLPDARAGRVMGLDLCMGDWLEPHPRLAELAVNLDNLYDISQADEDSLALVDPDSTGWTGMLAWEDRAYRPWSWSSGADFGYPAHWHRVILAGGPNLFESLLIRWGPWRIMLGAVVLTVCLTLSISVQLRRRHRRRMAALLTRLSALESQVAARPVIAPPGAVSSIDEALPETAPLAAPPTPDIVHQSLSYIQAHLQENLNVAQLADGVGVSTRTLQRVLRESLDCSPREAILASKMRLARNLLESGGWRVGEVADHLGYESPYHFSRLFKNFYHETPSSVIHTPTSH